MSAGTIGATANASGPDDPLRIPGEIVRAVFAHCLEQGPLECCGLLGGAGRQVLSWHPLGNLARSETRYQGDPRDLIEAWRWLREHGQEILAIYHSHPRWEAVPSATDLRENHWGEMTHLIVSLLTDPPTMRAWRLSPDSKVELSWTPGEPPGHAPVTLRPMPRAD